MAPANRRAKSIIGIAPPADGEITLAADAPRGARRRSRPAWYFLLCRRDEDCSRHDGGREHGTRPARRRTGAGVSWDAERIFQFFPRIKRRWRAPADYLSGGEQQMVAVGAGTGRARAYCCSTNRSKDLRRGDRRTGEASTACATRSRSSSSTTTSISRLHCRTARGTETGQVTHIGPSRALSTDLDMRRRCFGCRGEFVIPSARGISVTRKTEILAFGSE